MANGYAINALALCNCNKEFKKPDENQVLQVTNIVANRYPIVLFSLQKIPIKVKKHNGRKQ